MSKRTHEQQLAARKAKRQAERQAERARQRRNLVVTVTAVVAVVAVLVGVFVFFGPKGGDTPVADTPSTDAAPDNKPKSIPTALAPAPKRATPLPAEVNCSYKKGAEPASKKVDLPADGKTKASGTSKVSLNTSIG